jgi:hypothetical protein
VFAGSASLGPWLTGIPVQSSATSSLSTLDRRLTRSSYSPAKKEDSTRSAAPDPPGKRSAAKRAGRSTGDQLTAKVRPRSDSKLQPVSVLGRGTGSEVPRS